MELAPIALFVYNRPLHTQAVLDALEKNKLAKESLLYIFADGSKENATEDTLQKILETRNIIRKKQWCKVVHIVESEKNKGLANSIVEGVTEIVNKHGSIIVLEDDIVVSPFFLDYMNDGLTKYLDNPKVISIHAYNYPIETSGLPETFFIKGADCWGWSTWASQWKSLNTDAAQLLEIIQKKGLEHEFNIMGSYPYTQMLKNQAEKKISSWAICWYASAFLNDKYTLYPKNSIIYNIGFDKSGTHHAGFDHFNSDDWNNSKPVKVDVQHDIKSNQLALSRWKDYHEKNLTPVIEKPQNMLRRAKSIGGKIYRKIFDKADKNVQDPDIMWAGDYDNWYDAANKCEGYNAGNILQKIKLAVLKVKKGEAAFERDSVAFDTLDYSPVLLNIFQSIARENNEELCICDFGGSLGSSYFQYRNVLSNLKELKWRIIEQPHFVECGKQFIQDQYLKFFFTIEEAIAGEQKAALFLGSVIQYLEKPYEFIEKIMKYEFDHVIIDRTAFIEHEKEQITIQTVPEYIYKASYPSWFLNEKKFIQAFSSKYIVVETFFSEIEKPTTLKDGKPIYWKGFWFKKIQNRLN